MSKTMHVLQCFQNPTPWQSKCKYSEQHLIELTILITGYIFQSIVTLMRIWWYNNQLMIGFTLVTCLSNREGELGNSDSICTQIQALKKVPFNHPGQVDFPSWQVTFHSHFARWVRNQASHLSAKSLNEQTKTCLAVQTFLRDSCPNDKLEFKLFFKSQKY